MRDAVEAAQVSKSIMQRLQLVNTLSHVLSRVSLRLLSAGFKVLWSRWAIHGKLQQHKLRTMVTSRVNYSMRAVLRRMAALPLCSAAVIHEQVCHVGIPIDCPARMALSNPLARLASPAAAAALQLTSCSGVAATADRSVWLTPPAKIVRPIHHCNSEPPRRRQQLRPCAKENSAAAAMVAQTGSSHKEEQRKVKGRCLGLFETTISNQGAKRLSSIPEAHVKGTMSFLLLQRLYLRTVHNWWTRLAAVM
jgi:hypothetical protein